MLFKPVVGPANVRKKTLLSDDFTERASTAALPRRTLVELVSPPVGGAIQLLQARLWECTMGWLALSRVATSGAVLRVQNKELMPK